MSDPESLRQAAFAAVERHHTNGAAVQSEPPWPNDDHGAPEPPDTGGGVNEQKTPLLADRLLTRSALRALPDPAPLVDNVLDQGTTALLYGKWGTSKTLTALDWAASVATGRDWQGRSTKKHRVLYVAAEGASGFKGRVDAWETGWHTTIADAGELEILASQ